jgi:outer membrane immunogenic protein
MFALQRGVLVLGIFAGMAVTAMPAAADGGRGPPTYDRGYYPSIWRGVYGGVHAGFGWSGDADGAVGGAQAGYNWQSQQYVYGIEADISLSDIGVSGSVTACDPDPRFGCATARAGASIDWLATVRGRLGVLVQPSLLLYATAGLAVVHAEGHASVSIPGRPLLSASVSDSDTAFVYGVGVESKLSDTMSVRVEYLGFGDIDAVGDFGIVRAGLNFRFGN